MWGKNGGGLPTDESGGGGGALLFNSLGNPGRKKERTCGENPAGEDIHSFPVGDSAHFSQTDFIGEKIFRGR